MDELLEQLIELPTEQDFDLRLPDPSLVEHYRNRKERVIVVDYGIDCTLLREIGCQIINYNRQDKGVEPEKRKPIIMLINSGGGDLEATYATIAIMEMSKTPIITVNMNCAYSAAGLLLLAGHKRYCCPRSQMLIHSGSASGISGNYEDIQESTKSYKKMIEDLREFVMSKTKIDKKLMDKNKSKDWYLDVKQQTELGCVDEIITDIDVIL